MFIFLDAYVRIYMTNDGSVREGDVGEKRFFELLEAIFPEGEENLEKRRNGAFSLDLPGEVIDDLIGLGFIEKEDEDTQAIHNRFTLTSKGLKFLECIEKMNQLLGSSGYPIKKG